MYNEAYKKFDRLTDKQKVLILNSLIGKYSIKPRELNRICKKLFTKKDKCEKCGISENEYANLMEDSFSYYEVI